MASPSKRAQEIINKAQAEEKAKKAKEKRLGVNLDALNPSNVKKETNPSSETTTSPLQETTKINSGATPEQLEQIKKLHKHLGRTAPEELEGKSSDQYGEYIKTLKHARDTHNNAGLKTLEGHGITKHHLLEKGIRYFKVEPNTDKSRLEGNTLVLGRDHYYKRDNVDNLHKLLDTNKESHASTKAFANYKEMQDKFHSSNDIEDMKSYMQAGNMWFNLSKILKDNPKNGLAITKHLKEASKQKKRPAKQVLDFLLKYKGTK